MPRSWARSVVAALLTGGSLEAQIITENAGITSAETPEIHAAVSFIDADLGREFTWINQAIVSPDRHDEFKLTLPWIDREVDLPGGTVDLSGVGDLTLRWKHALARDDDVMRSRRWSTLVELTAPTGERDDADASLAIPPDLRLGRGDWAFGVGGAFTAIDDRHRFAVETMFRHRTSHAGFQLGDSADLNLAYWYRIAPGRFTNLAETTEIRGVIELLSSYRWPSELHGDAADDDGGLAWLAPGVQVYPRDWLLLEGNVQLPVAQSIDDAFGDREIAVVFSLKVLF